jgi:hypothetical protein
MEIYEQLAGEAQLLVVYQPMDDGNELDPLAIFSEIAADAAKRAADGHSIVTMTVLPLRHAQVFGRTGSGYETKTAVAVVYRRPETARA